MDSEDKSFIPLTSQPYFSNPVHRKRITFVSAALTTSSACAQVPASSTAISAADQYSSIVFAPANGIPTHTSAASRRSQSPALKNEASLCPTCHLPLPSSPATPAPYPHECLLAHQLSLPHSQPPSHLPRSNKGLQYLSSLGWDPDNRQGLGKSGEGIKVPIKAKVKADTSGLGVKVNKVRKEEPKKQMLDAGKIRKLEREDKKRKERLQREFWGTDDMKIYLGPG